MPNPDKISITIDNKILLHILAIGHLDISEEIPITLTQSGIAEAIDTPLGSVSRALKKLIDNGLLVEKLYHVRGKKRRMSAYFLTLDGEKFILGFEDNLVKKIIKFKAKDGDFQFIPISDLSKILGKKPQIIDVLNHISKLGYLDQVQFKHELEFKTKPTKEMGFLVKYLERMPKIRHFFDRTKELNFLVKSMRESKGTVVHGMAGIGKSTLAAKFIENFSESRNVFWYRFQEWDSVRNILLPLGEFLAEMNKKKLKYYLESNPNIDYFEILNILVNDLKKSNSILVFDDFQRVTDRIIQFFTSFAEQLENIDNIYFLVLSRSLIRFYDRRDVTVKNLISEMRLDGLDREGSRELVKPKALDKSGFNKIYEITKGHPLALELIESIDDLKHPTKDLMKFVHEEIFLKLDDNEKSLLKVISIFREPVSTDAIFLEDTIEYETLDNLLEKALLSEIEPSIYEVHDIIREFFYSRQTPKKRKEYHKKAAEYYQQKVDELAFIEAAYHLIQSDAQEDAAKLIIDRAPVVIEQGYHEEIMNILLSFKHTLNTKYLSQIYKLKGQILDIWGEWDNIFEYYYQCFTLGKYLNKFEDFSLNREQLHNTVGYMSWKTLEVDTALKNLNSSLAVVREVNDNAGENEIIRSLGWVSWLRGDYKKAISYYKQSLDGLEKLEIDTQEIKANVMINLGNIHWEQGDWERSIQYFTDSLDLFKELKNSYKQARIFNNIGCVYAEKGELSIALNFFNKGTKLSIEVYYIRGNAYTLLHQGEVLLRQKKFPEAQKVLEDALEIFTRIEDHLGIVYSKINIGLINFFYQNWYKAKDNFQSCADLMIDMDVGFYLGEVYTGLSYIHARLNNLDLVKEFKRNAENTFKSINNA